LRADFVSIFVVRLLGSVLEVFALRRSQALNDKHLLNSQRIEMYIPVGESAHNQRNVS